LVAKQTRYDLLLLEDNNCSQCAVSQLPRAKSRGHRQPSAIPALQDIVPNGNLSRDNLCKTGNWSSGKRPPRAAARDKVVGVGLTCTSANVPIEHLSCREFTTVARFASNQSPANPANGACEAAPGGNSRGPKLDKAG
jgi:hypothetical protein